MTNALSVRAVTGLGDVRPGDDLAGMIAAAAPWLADGDVVVVTSKIVSKAEGSLAPVPPDEGPQREAARLSVIAGESARIVATRGPTAIVATHHGFVMAAAGVDASNVDPTHLVLLPKDPDGSARTLRAELRDRFGLDVVVIVSDTMGRPWRVGLTDVALGVAGIDPVRDYRGERDAYGNELQITQMSPADEMAGAAELVKGKYDQVPVAVVRGLDIVGTPDGPGAAVALRTPDTDMFALGTAEARADGLRLAASLDDLSGVRRMRTPATLGAPIDVAADIARATAAGAGVVRWTVALTPEDPDGVVARLHGNGIGEIGPAGYVRVGSAVHAMRCLLAADGYLTASADPGEALVSIEVRRYPPAQT